MYSPQLGRFLSQDPLVRDPTILNDNNWFGDRLTEIRNLYGYCGNNPVTYTDPSGLIVDNPIPPHQPTGFPPVSNVPPTTTCTIKGNISVPTPPVPNGWDKKHILICYLGCVACNDPKKVGGPKCKACATDCNQIHLKICEKLSLLARTQCLALADAAHKAMQTSNSCCGS